MANALNMAIGGFQRVCDFDGIEPPSRAAVERMQREFPELYRTAEAEGLPDWWHTRTNE